MTIRTPVRIASAQTFWAHRVAPSKISDTMRLLVDSIDFSEEFGSGWEILLDLFRSVYYSVEYGNPKSDLLLWMLQLLRFELKIYLIESRCAEMLRWTFRTVKLCEVTNFLLDLDSDKVISLGNNDTILHSSLGYACHESYVSAVVARRPNLHGLSLFKSFTPYGESPTSLAMYSSRAFTYWLHALVNIGTDFESFIDQELEQSPEVHSGWHKATLLDLFTHGDRPDLHVDRNARICHDCGIWDRSMQRKVQPYWRFFLERIKAGLHPYDPALAESEVNEKESGDLANIEEAAFEAEPKLEDDTTGEYSAMTSLGPKCLYGKHEIVCEDCWLYYERSGTRRQALAGENISEDAESSSSDDSSECDYSPFLIHT